LLATLNVTAYGDEAILGSAGGPPMEECSGSLGFGANVVNLASGSLDIDLQPLRNRGGQVVAVSAVVRSCGGSGTLQISEAGFPGVLKSVAIEPSDAAFVISLQGADISAVHIDGQELVVDHIQLTLRCPGESLCAGLVADDFLGDGRPVKGLTFWGAYLNQRYVPSRLGGFDNDTKDVDGWFVSFHADQPQSGVGPSGYSRPDVLLGLYYCPSAAMDIERTSLSACDSVRRKIFKYRVNLVDCSPLIAARQDPRDHGSPFAMPPALGNAFRAQTGRVYWLGIQAVAGITYDPYTLQPQRTANAASDDFWGWLSTPPDQRLDKSVTGCGGVDLSGDVPPNWIYGDWQPVGRSPCVATDQAFHLISAEVEPRGP
jgi:hypothetical protein